MQRHPIQSHVLALLAVSCFILGVAVGVGAAKVKVDPKVFDGGSQEATAETLLGLARGMTEDGTWERIALARVLYLGGKKAEGQALLDEVAAERKIDASDWIRIGRVYWEAGDWDKAREVFEKVLSLAPKDEDWQAEIGAYYNLKGDRARAEELFRKSFSEDPGSRKNTLRVAGSYLGVSPY